MPQPEVICPICHKDLTTAIALLGHNPLEIWDGHMALHKKELVQDLCFQMERFKLKVPKDLKDAYYALDNGMKQLNDTRHLIKATQYVG